MTFRTKDCESVLFRGHIFCFGLPRLVLQRSQQHPFKLPGYLYVVALKKAPAHSISKRTSSARLDIYPSAVASCCRHSGEGSVVSMGDFTAMNKYFNQHQERNFRIVLDRTEDCCEFAFSTFEDLQMWGNVLQECVTTGGSARSRFRLSWHWGKRPDAPPRTQASLALPMYYYIVPEPYNHVPLTTVAITPLTHEYLQLYDESSPSDGSSYCDGINSASNDNHDNREHSSTLQPTSDVSLRQAITMTVYRSLQEQAMADFSQTFSKTTQSAWRKGMDDLISTPSNQRKEKASSCPPIRTVQFQAEAKWQPQKHDRYFSTRDFEKLISLNRQRNVSRIEECEQVYSEHIPRENN